MAIIISKLINEELYPNIQHIQENCELGIINFELENPQNYCFFDIFINLLKKESSLLPIAIIRSKEKEGFPYVVCNPKPKTVLNVFFFKV